MFQLRSGKQSQVVVLNNGHMYAKEAGGRCCSRSAPHRGTERRSSHERTGGPLKCADEFREPAFWQCNRMRNNTIFEAAKARMAPASSSGWSIRQLSRHRLLFDIYGGRKNSPGGSGRQVLALCCDLRTARPKSADAPSVSRDALDFLRGSICLS